MAKPAILALIALSSTLCAQGLAAQEGPDSSSALAPPEGVAPELPEIVITPPKAEYRDLDATLLLFSRWVEARPDAASLVSLGTSAGGRPITALRIAAPGPVPADARKTLLLVGGLDGVSLHGAEEVLGIAAGLASEPERLPPDLAFLCLPWASPDGLSAEFLRLKGAGPGSLGRDETPVDDDLDGLNAEDGPDDLDGDGLVTMMLVEDAAGEWQRAPDARFLVPAGRAATAGPRYSLFREGKDDDGDGVYNEDGAGGIRADHNFTVGWRGPFASVSPGALPFRAPGASALKALQEEGRLVGVLLFDGHSGHCEVAGGQKRGALESLSGKLFAKVLGATGDEIDALTSEHPAAGDALDWLPRVGTPTARLSFWGPEIGLGRGLVKPAAFRTGDEALPDDMLEDFCSPSCIAASVGGWRRYLDERRGGIGFIDWHPVDLGDGQSALVGGWEAAVLNNPPEEQLAQSVTMAMDLMGELIAALPEVHVEVTSVSREGELCTLKAKLQASGNEAGSLPIELMAPGGLELQLELPPGARLIAGPAVESIASAELAAGEIEWLIFAPLDSLLTLRIVRSSDGIELDRSEVRP